MLDLSVRKSQIVRVLAITFVLNLVIALAKLGYGYFTHTLSMVADGFHSLMDSTSNIVGFVAVAYAFDPPDEDHPYGHRKAEIVASMLIAVMLGLTCLEIIKEVASRLSAPVTPEVSVFSFVIMVVGVLINFWVVWYETRAGKAFNSHLLLSDAMHTRSDVLVSLSVLVSLGAITLRWYWLDLLVSLGITLVIGKMAVQLFRENLGILIDQTPIDRELVREKVKAVSGVYDCHQIRAHGLSDAIYLELHIWVDPNLRVTQAHELSHQVKDALHSAFPGLLDATIHIEPADLP
ncbi:cation transporter [bacterium (Candidatus Blackallbacteria) CG17_big_fil_post_rev_8_21_14_2_50_48_46]|uniref:Cation transporter n=1 Tax=bacterium (Candidatus Blackallbacteria) CG17_big_fil_post_rev_8_21_14_2_50_48_46 TaxID=2014261 RepID=A0A2M7FX74_9BACT|nr:MAG: cation-efflux pump [bacterium (Candidatus Blackallbacteria) CG18_big_fil_WC_8_21_14_2_50_49_26]PIW13735.1 MAG: cation transporter [bacterium (Candidatus Blackallbacteria) CG17_big_fil_post_rev_8_21_14_2_50_48_46]PIW44961.1 MAG: cation transporter [bacterium (Candidatus Blackallbacteria) CG13_big_fil_rev_8_21_14_2_50_49_14]